VVKVVGDKMKFGIRVIADDTQPYDEEGNPRDDEECEIQWDESDFSTVYDRKFSHIAQESDAGFAVSTSRKVPNEMFVDSDEESEQEVDMEREERMSSKANGKATVAKTRPGPMMVLLDDEEDGDVEMEDDKE
jgi:hypothetical protein